MSTTGEYREGLVNYIIGSKDFLMSTIEREYVRLIKEYVPNVWTTVEFPLTLARTPAVALTVHNIVAKDFSLGNILSQDNDGNIIYGLQWNFTLNIDVWAQGTITRDNIISAISVMLMTTRELMYHRVGLINSVISSSQERGFDKTDRIIQYASHQLTEIQRQLITVEMSIMASYKPIIEYGYLTSIVFTLGNNYYDVNLELQTATQTSTFPSETGTGFEDIAPLPDLFVETDAVDEIVDQLGLI
jgi:hypothetical protein